MLQRGVVYVFLVMCCLSCSQDEAQETSDACALIDCATISLRLEFVAAATGEDLFLNETFSIDSLQIIDTQTNQAINFFVETLGSGARTTIVLPAFLESSALENYQIFIPEMFDVSFSFSVNVVEDPCCLGNEYTNVTLASDDISLETIDTGRYRLLF